MKLFNNYVCAILDAETMANDPLARQKEIDEAVRLWRKKNADVECIAYFRFSRESLADKTIKLVVMQRPKGDFEFISILPSPRLAAMYVWAFGVIEKCNPTARFTNVTTSGMDIIKNTSTVWFTL